MAQQLYNLRKKYNPRVILNTTSLFGSPTHSAAQISITLNRH